MRRDKKRSQTPVRQPHLSNDEQSSYAFRRSRTITGSTAETVRSAGENRAQLRSPRLHEHSLRSHRRKLLLYLLLSLFAAVSLWYVISHYIGNSAAMRTTGGQAAHTELDVDRYNDLLKQYLSARPFERFSFAFNNEAFAEYLNSKAPEVVSAQLEEGDGFGEATLLLVLREPVVGWTIKGQQYFVDAEGVAFTRNYFAAPAVVVTDKSGISADVGVIASSKQLRFIGRVISLINASSVGTVERVELPANSTRQVDFKLSGRDYIIKTHLDRDPAGQAADIVNALRHVDTKGIVPAYLDIRVSSKAFYR